MRRSFVLGAVLAVALFLAGFGLAGRSAAVKLTARLNAAQETPAPKATGAAGGTFIGTLSGRRLTWRLTFARLTGRALAAHIHLGRLGVAGPVAVPLCGPCVSGVHRTAMLTARVRAALLTGTAYVNVHTARNAAGEIRGQVAGPHGVMPAPAAPTTTTTTSQTATTGPYGY
jgi:hypothetical protein